MRVSGVFTQDSLFGRQGRRNALDDIGGAPANAGIRSSAASIVKSIAAALPSK